MKKILGLFCFFTMLILLTGCDALGFFTTTNNGTTITGSETTSTSSLNGSESNGEVTTYKGNFVELTEEEWEEIMFNFATRTIYVEIFTFIEAGYSITQSGEFSMSTTINGEPRTISGSSVINLQAKGNNIHLRVTSVNKSEETPQTYEIDGYGVFSVKDDGSFETMWLTGLQSDAKNTTVLYTHEGKPLYALNDTNSKNLDSALSGLNSQMQSLSSVIQKYEQELRDYSKSMYPYDKYEFSDGKYVSKEEYTYGITIEDVTISGVISNAEIKIDKTTGLAMELAMTMGQAQSGGDENISQVRLSKVIGIEDINLVKVESNSSESQEG